MLYYRDLVLYENTDALTLTDALKNAIIHALDNWTKNELDLIDTSYYIVYKNAKFNENTAKMLPSPDNSDIVSIKIKITLANVEKHDTGKIITESMYDFNYVIVLKDVNSTGGKAKNGLTIPQKFKGIYEGKLMCDEKELNTEKEIKFNTKDKTSRIETTPNNGGVAGSYPAQTVTDQVTISDEASNGFEAAVNALI